MRWTERPGVVAVASDPPDRPVTDAETLRKLMDRDAGGAEVSDALVRRLADCSRLNVSMRIAR